MLPRCLRLASAVGRCVKFRVEGVEVFGIQVILDDPQAFAEPLEMHHLALPQEPDRITDFRVFDQAEDIVVGGTGFLLCCNHVRTTFWKNLTGRAVFPGKK